MTVRHFAKSAMVMVAAVGLASSAFAETLKQAVEETVNTNPDILIAAKTRLVNEEVYKQARALYFPRVDAGAGYGVQRSKNNTVAARLGRNDYDTLHRRESSVRLNQLIFDGWGTPSEVAARRADVRATAYDVAAVSQDIGLEAVNAYIEVLRTQELVTLAKANVSAHRRTFDMIKQRSDSGLNREADVDQATGRLALAQANLEARQSERRDAQIEYLRVIGHAPEGVHSRYLPKMSVPSNQEQVVGLALVNHPRIHQAQYEIEQANHNYYVARSLFWPRLDAQLGSNWNRNIDGARGTDNDYYAMLRMEYNLFNGGGDLARVREAKYVIQRAEESHRLTERQVAESARLSWNDYRTARDRAHDLKIHRDSAKKTVEAYRQQFTLGKRTVLDLLDVENEFFNASNAYANERYNESYARFRLFNSMGTLLQSLGVALPVEAYDDFGHKRHTAYGSGDYYPNPKNPQEVEAVPVSYGGPVYSEANAPQSKAYAKVAPKAASVSAPMVAQAQPQPVAAPSPVIEQAASQPASTQRAAVAASRSSSPLSAKQIARMRQQQQRAAQQFAQARQSNVVDHVSQISQPSNTVPPSPSALPQSIASSIASEPSNRRFRVQAGTFSNEQNALRLLEALRSQGFDAQIFKQSSVSGNEFSRVMVTPDAAGLTAAEATQDDIERTFQLRSKIITG